jgi:hypothetical protein
MMQALIRLLLLVGWGIFSTLALSAADGQQGRDREQKPVPPSFKPGAEVTLAITLQAPEHWHLNYLVPLRLQFDEEYLEEAPFSVEKPVWDFSFDDYVESYTARLPLVLGADLPEGVLTIPLRAMCSICDESGESCTFSQQDAAVPLIVRIEAPAEQKNQALLSGELPYALKLEAP